MSVELREPGGLLAPSGGPGEYGEPVFDSPWRTFWRRFARNRVAVVAALVLIAIAFIAAAAPLIASIDQRDSTNLKGANKPPGWEGHILGTDDIGRDVFARLIWGGRVSLTVGLTAVAISIVVGILIGSLSGFFGGWMDNVLMRFTDVFLSIPTLALLIVGAAILGPSIHTTMIIIGLVSWPGVARLVRGEILSLRGRDFVTAARAAGASSGYIIRKHLVPNSMAPVLVSATLSVAGTIILEASLSFLGLGVQQPIPSWGNMLEAATNWRVLTLYWWQWMPPGFMIFLTALCIYIVGDALRDATDPRLK
ncbi:MAG: ABC transporter permease [Clostridiales bacterium]|nr:ABC transporter permease [Clostridiales bacterium]